MLSTIIPYTKQPRLTLVGAGPGDPELITLKAVNALRTADVVLYDALVSDEILKLIPETIPVLSVGKRAGSHSFSQQEINELIVEFAYSYGHVIRLKGGDPFVFGRATEEIEFAAKHGIETTVIPGISSALAVPAALNIPVTARGISESLWVVTGTTASGEISSDITLAAQSSATIVILMGVKKINDIMAIFKQQGKSDTPVAVIQNGTRHDQKSVVGTVATIADLVHADRLGGPAIIIVGEVVRYNNVREKIISTQLGESR
jgi:uroporphyrin-III C-methyltransferase